MKKVSVPKSNKKLTNKHSNVKFAPCDPTSEISKTFGFNETECIAESQDEYIENLQQQVFVLEQEINYLRTCTQENTKQYPSMIAEGERMAKKLTEYQNDIRNLKIDLKRKQTSIDLLKSEKGRMQKFIEELEEKIKKEKCKILEDLYTLQKERDFLIDKHKKCEELLVEKKEAEQKLQEKFDNIEVDFAQIERERKCDKDIINDLMETKEKLQKDFLQAKMTLEAQPSNKGEEAIKALKEDIQNIHEEMEGLKRSYEHEHLLRERLSQDNADLIKRHADLEAQFAEVKAQLREEQSLRSSLEQVHLSTVLDAAEAKGRDAALHEKIDQLRNLLKEESEQCQSMTRQLVDEKRFKKREEEKLLNLQERFDQQDEANKTLKKENIGYIRDNTFLNDKMIELKQQLQIKDGEILNFKQKAQEMQVQVEEFMQNSQAANKQAGERWKQLNQLAHHIQAITCAETPDT